MSLIFSSRLPFLKWDIPQRSWRRRCRRFWMCWKWSRFPCTRWKNCFGGMTTLSSSWRREFCPQISDSHTTSSASLWGRIIRRVRCTRFSRGEKNWWTLPRLRFTGARTTWGFGGRQTVTRSKVRMGPDFLPCSRKTRRFSFISPISAVLSNFVWRIGSHRSMKGLRRWGAYIFYIGQFVSEPRIF